MYMKVIHKKPGQPPHMCRTDVKSNIIMLIDGNLKGTELDFSGKVHCFWPKIKCFCLKGPEI